MDFLDRTANQGGNRLEPNASATTDRVAALKQAHDLGLRTYAMLCAPVAPTAFPE
jgi:DNA repair photolyase